MPADVDFFGPARARFLGFRKMLSHPLRGRM